MGATTSWLHSGTLKKFFAEICESLNPKSWAIQMIRESLSVHSRTRIGETKQVQSWSVKVSGACTRACYFIASVSFSRFFSVLERWFWSLLIRRRSKSDNSSTKWPNLLEELSSWTEELFFSCKMTWCTLQWWSFAQTLGYFVCWSGHFCLSFTVRDTNPDGILS